MALCAAQREKEREGERDRVRGGAKAGIYLNRSSASGAEYSISVQHNTRVREVFDEKCNVFCHLKIGGVRVKGWVCKLSSTFGLVCSRRKRTHCCEKAINSQ